MRGETVDKEGLVDQDDVLPTGYDTSGETQENSTKHMTVTITVPGCHEQKQSSVVKNGEISDPFM